MNSAEPVPVETASPARAAGRTAEASAAAPAKSTSAVNQVAGEVTLADRPGAAEATAAGEPAAAGVPVTVKAAGPVLAAESVAQGPALIVRPPQPEAGSGQHTDESMKDDDADDADVADDDPAHLAAQLTARGFDVHMSEEEYRQIRAIYTRSQHEGLTTADIQWLDDRLAADPDYFETLPVRGVIGTVTPDAAVPTAKPRATFIPSLDEAAAMELKTRYEDAIRSPA